MRAATCCALSVLALLLAAAGCGGSSEQVADISGTWSVTLVTGQNSCGLAVGARDAFSITIAQQAGNASFAATGGVLDAAPGTIDGATLTMSMSTETPSCAPEFFDLTAMLNAAGDGAAGTATWTCTVQGQTCSGTSSFAMSRP